MYGKGTKGKKKDTDHVICNVVMYGIIYFLTYMHGMHFKMIFFCFPQKNESHIAKFELTCQKFLFLTKLSL